MFLIYSSTLVHWEELTSWTAVCLFPQSDPIIIRSKDIIFLRFRMDLYFRFTVLSCSYTSWLTSSFIFFHSLFILCWKSWECLLHGCLAVCQPHKCAERRFKFECNTERGQGQPQLCSDMHCELNDNLRGKQTQVFPECWSAQQRLGNVCAHNISDD